MVQTVARWQAWWRGEDVLDRFALSPPPGRRTEFPSSRRGKVLILYPIFLYSKPGGEGRIRTSEGIANRFTVCPLWPLGNLSDTNSQFL